MVIFHSYVSLPEGKSMTKKKPSAASQLGTVHDLSYDLRETQTRNAAVSRLREKSETGNGHIFPVQKDGDHHWLVMVSNS